MVPFRPAVIGDAGLDGWRAPAEEETSGGGPDQDTSGRGQRHKEAARV